jgi:hypothetical protein
MSNRVVSIPASLVEGVGRNNVIDLIMAHDSLTEINKSAEDGCNKNE